MARLYREVDVFLALKKTIETEAFTLLSLDVFAQEIAANKDLLSSNELVVNVPVKLPVKFSFTKLPPKKEHKSRPSNKIKKRNNASIFIV